MDKKAMPHESVISPDGSPLPYDGLIECLKLIEDLDLPCPIDSAGCNNCSEKIKSYGFTPETWSGYREFMKSYDNTLNYQNIMRQVVDVMPVWDQIGNKLQGFYNRKTQEWVDKTNKEPLIANWVLINCKFSRLSS